MITKKTIFWAIAVFSVFFLTNTCLSVSPPTKITILASDTFTLEPEGEITLLFPQFGGAYVCFGLNDPNRIFLEESELPVGFSEVGVKEAYQGKSFPVFTFAGSGDDSRLHCQDELVQEILDKIELID